MLLQPGAVRLAAPRGRAGRGGVRAAPLPPRLRCRAEGDDSPQQQQHTQQQTQQQQQQQQQPADAQPAPQEAAVREGEPGAAPASSPAQPPPRPAPPAPPSPWSSFLTAVQPRVALRVALQVAALLALSRLLGAGLRQSAASAPRVLGAPYSTFVQAAQSHQVATAQVEGDGVLWQRRPAAAPAPPATAAAAARGGRWRGASRPQAQPHAQPAQPQRPQSSSPPPATLSAPAPPPPVYYYSAKPADAAVPYAALSSGGAVFGAPDRRGAAPRALSLLLAALYALALASLLGRALPRLRLPGAPPRFGGAQIGGGGGGKGGKGRGGGGRGGADAAAPPDVTFADVAGVDEAKEELQELVAVLREPERFAALGARPPAGVLLVGAPGTGKTLLARAVAGEAGVPFFAFVELYVGMGASRVREVYARARAAAPSIVFLDEIDAVAKGRADGRLLTELDGFDTGGSERGPGLVITLAATNRPDVLDDALKRPGRFDRTVSVALPDRQGRQDILAVHARARGLPLAPDADLRAVAAATPGCSGADLAALVNEAAMQAARSGRTTVGAEHFTAAVLRSLAGPERKRSVLFGAERAVVARHEAGHALVGACVADALPAGTAARCAAISILSRTSGALGWAYSPPPSGDAAERVLLFSDELRGRLCVLMAGRAAEAATGAGRVSTGASDDIARATQLAVRAVAEFGLGRLGPLAVAQLGGGGGGGGGGGVGEGLFGGPSTGPAQAQVEAEVQALLGSALAAARDALGANAGLLEELGARLEADEKVGGPTLAAYLARARPSPRLTAFLKGAGAQ